jgi:hypothetical protein
LTKTAFVPRAGIALYPPEQVAPVIYDIPDEEFDADRTNKVGNVKWLEDKLEDKRRGKISYVSGGPVLKGSFVN